MKNEYGRSMIEMLGVLAIIGVLSIGGLAGYTMAMNRHKANNVLDYASRVAVLAQTAANAYNADTPCGDVLGEVTVPSGVVSCVIGTSGGGNGEEVDVVVTTSGADVANAVADRDGANGIKISASGENVTFEFGKS